jgi:uncharacterized membrane protein
MAPESRVPAFAAALIAIAGQTWVFRSLGFSPVWPFPAVSAVLLFASIAIYVSPWDEPSSLMRGLSAGLIGVLVIANAVSIVLLVRGVFLGTSLTALGLLGTGCVLWAVNIALFALAYWEIDGGGPEARTEHEQLPDLVFPQQQANGPGLVPDGWQPGFGDYLYVSLTAATAFSPTDTMPYSRKAKLVMAVEATMSIAIVAMLVARAVNIARG